MDDDPKLGKIVRLIAVLKSRFSPPVIVDPPNVATRDSKIWTLDRTLALIGVVVALAVSVSSRNPVTVTAVSVVIFAVLVHPLWTCEFVCKSWIRRGMAMLLLMAVCFLFAYESWPSRDPKFNVILSMSFDKNRGGLIIHSSTETNVELLAYKFRSNNIVKLTPPFTLEPSKDYTFNQIDVTSTSMVYVDSHSDLLVYIRNDIGEEYRAKFDIVLKPVGAEHSVNELLVDLTQYRWPKNLEKEIE